MVLKKYLTINIVGHAPVKAWQNNEATAENKQPHFKGDGVAVWVNEYEEKPKEETPKTVEELI